MVADVSGASFSADGFLSPGLNTIEVQVARRDGTSQVVTSHVTYAPQPVVAFTAPAFCGPYMVPTPITFTVDAASLASTITKVDFFDGNTLLGTATSPPYTISPTYTAFGSRVITATATDANGFTGSATMIVTTQTQPPQVHVTSPLDGSTYKTGAAVPLAATATDPDGTISSLSILVDGGLAVGGSSPLSTNYTFTSAGSHVITARATDDSGNTVTSTPVTVNISANTPPSVSLTSPIGGASYAAPASVTLQAIASDSDGTIRQVQFQRDSGIVVATVTQPPYTATANNLTAGSHSFTAIATDDSNAQTTSAAVSINVVNDALPTVSITSPAQNSSFAPPANVAITAAASDSDGSIAKVEFLADGNLIGTVLSSPYTFTWTNAPLGTHSLTVRATDNLGAATTSAPITITVAGITSTITAPADGSTFVAPAGFTIQATSTTSSGNITSVDFLDGATLIQTITIPTGFATVNVSQGVSGVAAGTHVYTVKSHDDGGRVGNSPGVTVVVTAPPAPPAVSLTNPISGSFYIAPAIVHISADATVGSNSIAKVDFFANSTLIGTATTTPYVVAWSNGQVGSYNLSATVTDSAGIQGASATVSITIAPAPIITVDGGLDGSTVADDTVLVTGTLLSEPNSGVTVNGVTAEVDPSGRWAANRVPLASGANSLVVQAFTIDGLSTSQTITVTRSGSNPFELDVDPQGGLAPHKANFIITNRGNIAIKKIEMDLSGDGVLQDITAVGLTFAADYAEAGFYRPRVVVTAQDDQVYQAQVALVVRSGAVVYALAKGVLAGMLDRLQARDLDHALNRVTASMGPIYRDPFNALSQAGSLAVSAAQFGAVQRASLSGGYIELLVTRQGVNGADGYWIHLIRGADGIWRIDSM